MDDTAPEVLVSDHALVRYLERVRGMDLEAFRDEIRDMLKRGEVVRGKAVNGPNDDSTLIVVQFDNTVVTVLPPGFRRKASNHGPFRRLIRVPATPQEQQQ